MLQVLKKIIFIRTMALVLFAVVCLSGCATSARNVGLSPAITVKSNPRMNQGRILSVDNMFDEGVDKTEQSNFLKKAQEAIEAKNYQEALTILKKVLTLNPDNMEAAILIINTETLLSMEEEKKQRELEFEKEAAKREQLKNRMEIMKKSISENEGRKKAENLYLKGANAFYAKKYAEALELFRKGLVLNPEHEQLNRAFIRTKKRIDKVAKKKEIENKLKRRFDDFLEEITRRQEESSLVNEPDIEFDEGEDLPEIEYIQTSLDEEFVFEMFPENWTSSMREAFLRDKSIEIYREAIKRFPFSEKAAKAYYKIGEHHYANKEYDEAKKSFKQVVDSFFDSPYAEDSAHKILSIEYDKKNWEEALLLSYDFIDAFPLGKHKKDTYFKLGRIYEAQKKYKKAYSTYLDMIEIWTDDQERVDIHFKFANLYDLQGETEKALEKYQEIMDNYKDTSMFDEAQYKLAEIFYKKEMYPEAKMAYIDIVQSYALNPYRFDAFMRLAELFRMEKDYVKELSMYSQVIKSFPHSGKLKEVYLLRGKAYRNAGFYLKAIEALRDVIEYFPDDKVLALIVFYDTAVCYEKLDNIKEAYVFLDKIINNKEADQSFRNKSIEKKADLLIQEQNYTDALTTYSKLQDDKIDVGLRKQKYYQMGVCSFDLKDYKKSIQYFSFYLEIADLNIEIEKAGRAMVYQVDAAYKIENYSYAIEVCAKIIEKFPDNPHMGWVLYQMGKCHEKISKYKLAIDFYQRLIDSYPTHELVKQAGWDIKNIRWTLKDKAILQDKILN